MSISISITISVSIVAMIVMIVLVSIVVSIIIVIITAIIVPPHDINHPNHDFYLYRHRRVVFLYPIVLSLTQRYNSFSRDCDCDCECDRDHPADDDNDGRRRRRRRRRISPHVDHQSVEVTEVPVVVQIGRVPPISFPFALVLSSKSLSS